MEKPNITVLEKMAAFPLWPVCSVKSEKSAVRKHVPRVCHLVTEQGLPTSVGTCSTLDINYLNRCDEPRTVPSSSGLTHHPHAMEWSIRYRLCCELIRLTLLGTYSGKKKHPDVVVSLLLIPFLPGRGAFPVFVCVPTNKNHIHLSS